jgi:hypothetical protein
VQKYILEGQILKMMEERAFCDIRQMNKMKEWNRIDIERNTYAPKKASKELQKK